MVEVLSACANLGALEQGKWVHDYIRQNGLVLNVYLGTALVDMYAKCGNLDEAYEVFRAMRVKNVCTWNVLISAYAMNGRAEEALTAFYRMIFEDYKPDDVTFLAVLSACFQQGLVDEGRSHFRSMKEEFGLEPRIEHYSLMVDLLGRSGHLDEVLELIRTMPLIPDPTIWRALLRFSHIRGNTYLAEVVILKLIELEPNNGDNLFLLSNLYSQQERWAEVREVRETMKARGIQEIPGYSSIEIDNLVHEFVASCYTEPGLKGVYELLANIGTELTPADSVADSEENSLDAYGKPEIEFTEATRKHNLVRFDGRIWHLTEHMCSTPNFDSSSTTNTLTTSRL
ncbi:hypothetical protein Cgig2_006101 [Carnegiea gigantea]|uniref:Pentatricopeptide repeat-containing protein n=1 Tax=Carnegiea gigantea TaxID=171969 RepID=A0A9Q1QST6_9CARY|nr:hypothetical protein Cgig2_006101 [Carnegiea gigantea]